MGRRTLLALLVWLAGWAVVAAVLGGLFLLVGRAAPGLSPRLLPFFLVDLLIVFPLVAVASTRLVWPRLWVRSRRTHLTVAGSGRVR